MTKDVNVNCLRSLERGAVIWQREGAEEIIIIYEEGEYIAKRNKTKI